MLGTVKAESLLDRFAFVKAGASREFEPQNLDVFGWFSDDGAAGGPATVTESPIAASKTPAQRTITLCKEEEC